MENFVIIVDGEVAGNIPVPEPSEHMPPERARAYERMIAALSSNPVVIKHDIVQPGSTWDGKKFSPPVE